MSFREDFLWGVSTAAVQIEGAWNADGKGPSIWDALHKGHIDRNENSEIAADFYHRYKEDVAIMKELGLKHFRFSISWPRVLPNGIGKVNQAGLDYYSDLIDELLAAGIEPLATLYHWDFPYELYKKGGWKNDESSNWFEEYTKVVVDALGDRVRYWLTFNEPQMFMFLGHTIGVHAPFEHACEDELLTMSKNILLSHGKAVKIIRDALGSRAQIGFSPTGDCSAPKSNTEAAINQAFEDSLHLGYMFVYSNTWWCDPIFFGKFPQEAYERFGDKMISFTDEEFALVSQPLDFFAYNLYQVGAEFTPSGMENKQFEYPGSPITAAGWSVTPSALYWSAKFWHKRYGLPVFITENGMSSCDWVAIDGRVHDHNRIDFLTRYLSGLKKAADEGVDIMGYTHWSFTDNFEWAAGYRQQYGLVHIDFRTLKRTIKESGYWYKALIECNGESLPDWDSLDWK